MELADPVGTHATHCCKVCGCKYGNDDCPVVNGTVLATYECWECENRKEEMISSLVALSDTDFVEIVETAKFKRVENGTK